jgi:hypothetical protein
MSHFYGSTSVKGVIDVERLNNSRNGNPRYRFTFDGGETMKTAPDAGWVYSINPDSLIGRPVAATYHVTKTGRAVLDGVATCQPWQDAAVRGAA